jgi:hypothetical protein
MASGGESIKIVLKEIARDATKEDTLDYETQPQYIFVESFVVGLRPWSLKLLRQLANGRRMLWQRISWLPLRKLFLRYAIWRGNNERKLQREVDRQEIAKLYREVHKLKKGRGF